MAWSDPLKRLKWGIPVRRVVDEDIDSETHDNLKQQHITKEAILQHDKAAVIGLQAHNYENISDSDQNIDDIPQAHQELEYRDEANRKWYAFFDEYEYRLPRTERKTHRWYHWYNKNDTKAERRLMIKIDLTLTFVSMMVYWIKYLDQTNLNNAYVMGLAEDVGMKGNDLVNTQAIFNVGNIIFQIPFMYILVALPLNYVLPGLDLIWSILTICTYKVHNVGGLKAIRFFISVCESGAYLAFQYLFGSFIFEPDAIARRSMVYYFGQYLGVLTSGLLAGAIERGLEGYNNLSSWQWMFIVDGCISILCGAIIPFYTLPGTPNDCYSIFFTDDEIRLLRYRLKQNHTGGAGSPRDTLRAFCDWSLWKSIFTSWEIYVLSLWNIFCWCNNNGSSGAYIFWLKSLTKTNAAGDVVARFSGGKLQDLTALTPALGLLWLLLTCTFADQFRSRWGAIVLSQVFNITGNVILAVWDVPERAKWFAWCLQYFGWAMAPVLYSWQNDICRRDSRKRAVILVTMNMLAQTTTTWTSVLVWKTVEKPRYLKGYSFTAAAAFALVLWTPVVLWFYKRQERKYARQNGIVLYNSKEDPEFMSRVEKSRESDRVEQSRESIESPILEKEPTTPTKA